MRKNRKLYVSLLVLLCLLCLGIGYAALSGELIIGGTIATGSADQGNLQVYLVEAKDKTVDPNIKCNPTLTGAGIPIDRVADYSTGYATGNIQITEFRSTSTSAYAQFVIVNCESSSHDVVIGYTAEITYDGDDIDNINDYFTIRGYFDNNFLSEPDVSKFGNEDLQEIELSSSLACSFFVEVSMKEIPQDQLFGVRITITLTYNAK